ncbi:MAG: peptidyl-tRNA hydrolase Pth2 [Thermoplasmata archaeon]|nr:peptidyl-tRNA hydrolase Pth2 [Thermoplasmata archaeon]
MPSRPTAGGAYKMVLVVRGELRLTAGKAAVQVAHAAVMLYQEAERRRAPTLEAWLAGGQKKIAVVAPTLDAMLELQRTARGVGLATVLVEDAGFTEVAPGTKTVLGIGPGPENEVDRVTGGLPLL